MISLYRYKKDFKTNKNYKTRESDIRSKKLTKNVQKLKNINK